MTETIWYIYLHLCILAITYIAYAIGSIPTGYLLVKRIKSVDIRTIGSGSTGATNVKRALGKRGFFLVLLLDFLKGFLPVIAAQWIEYQYGLYYFYHVLPVFVGIAVIVGHSKSMFLEFTGGKSAASGLGVLTALCWPIGIITAVIWTIITLTTRYISLASIIAAVLAPIWMIFVFKQPLSYSAFALLGAIYVIYRHKDNIKRLKAGTENKITWRK